MNQAAQPEDTREVREHRPESLLRDDLDRIDSVPMLPELVGRILTMMDDPKVSAYQLAAMNLAQTDAANKHRWETAMSNYRTLFNDYADANQKEAGENKKGP